MKVLFVDHSFHKKTLSSNFFFDLLVGWFTVVDCVHLDTTDGNSFESLASANNYDLVVLWQLDYLAPVFLNANCPTVVVPMYDGSANLPFEHWISMQRAFIVCFSRTLFERVLACGCRALLLKYYLEPINELELPSFDSLRAFLWLRRPEDSLDPDLVEGLFGDQLGSLHIHNAPDSGRPVSIRQTYTSLSRVTFSESAWSANKSGYQAALAKANVFIAPRMSEGIGIAMLEAFSRGMLIVANDDSVHDEYVANWVTGILFNRNSISRTHVSKLAAQEMSMRGWLSAKVGYAQWKGTLPSLKEFLVEAAEKRETLSFSPNINVAIGLNDALCHGIDPYVRFLRDNVISGSYRLPHPKLADQVQKHLMADHSSIPYLGDNGLFFGIVPSSVGRKVGLSGFDYFSARIAASAVGFSFRLTETFVGLTRAVLILSADLMDEASGTWYLLVHINYKLVCRLDLPTIRGRFERSIPLSTGSGGETDVLITVLSADVSVPFDEIPHIRLFSVASKEEAL